MDFSSQDFTVSVKNLHENVTKELIEELFIQLGPIEDITFYEGKQLPQNSSTPVKPVAPYAYVEFVHEDSVAFACEMLDRLKLFGKPIKVSPRSKYQIFKMIENREISKKLQRKAEKIQKKEEKKIKREKENEEKIRRKQERKEEKLVKKWKNREERKSLRKSEKERKELRYGREEMLEVNASFEIKNWVAYCFERFEIKENEELQYLGKHKKEGWYQEMLKTSIQTNIETPKVQEMAVFPMKLFQDIPLDKLCPNKQEKLSKAAVEAKALPMKLFQDIPLEQFQTQTPMPNSDPIENFKDKLNDLSTRQCSCKSATSSASKCETCHLLGSLILLTLDSWEKHIANRKKHPEIQMLKASANELSLVDVLPEEHLEEESIDKGYMQVSVPRKKNLFPPKKFVRPVRGTPPDPNNLPISTVEHESNRKRKVRKREKLALSLEDEVDKEFFAQERPVSEPIATNNKVQEHLALPDTPKIPKSKEVNGRALELVEDNVYLCCDICQMEFNDVRKFRSHVKSHSSPNNKPTKRKGALSQENNSSSPRGTRKTHDLDVNEFKAESTNGFVANRRLPGGMFRRGIRVIKNSNKKRFDSK